jgi:PAS domain S-box-containing protein
MSESSDILTLDYFCDLVQAVKFRTDANGMIIKANPYAFDLFKYTPADLNAGITLYQIIAPELHPVLEKNLEQLRSGQRTQSEYIGLKKTGERIYILVNSIPLIDNAEFIGIEGMVINISNLKIIKEQEIKLQQAQKMEAVGTMAGGIAHDFNNILTVITGYSELLGLDLDKSSQKWQYLSEVLQAADRAKKLTQQLLAFSRKQILNPSVIDLNLTITNLTDMLRRLIGDDVSLDTALAPDLGSIRVDNVQLEQALINLVLNARDALPEGGAIRIQTRNVQIKENLIDRVDSPSDLPSGNYALVSVQDTGVGMDKTVLEHIFEPFFSTKGKFGTGLGLSMVFGFVKQSGGSISVDSIVGEGTNFRLYFPLVESPTATKSSKDPSFSDKPKPMQIESIVSGAEKPRILVVEDENSVRSFIFDILSRAGYEVYQAESGVAALRFIYNNNINLSLMITDIIMPQLNGYELAARVKKYYPKIKLLFITGYDQKNPYKVDSGVTGDNLLMKPFDIDVFLKKVKEILDADST